MSFSLNINPVSKSSSNAKNDTQLSTKSFTQAPISTLLLVNKWSKMQITPPEGRCFGVQPDLASPHQPAFSSLLTTGSQVINSRRTKVLCKVVQKYLNQAGNRGLAVSTAAHKKDQSCLNETWKFEGRKVFIYHLSENQDRFFLFPNVNEQSVQYNLKLMLRTWRSLTIL